MPVSAAGAATDADLLGEIASRRTFAIISHPDAGKTTLTEKFLLYAGAVHEAGAVKSRKHARTAVSDWMELERQRGISISSTVLHFAYRHWKFNLLDTPGHADFSEDTYRTLCAADAAIMVLDLAKGIEPQTLKLFRVCADRGLPIVTFVNKCDRPGRAPLALVDEIRDQIGLEAVPMTWPVADGGDFAGVVDRQAGELVRFQRTVQGAQRGEEERLPLEKAQALAAGGGKAAAMATAGHVPGDCPLDRWIAAMEELELLDEVAPRLDQEAFLRGRQTPVFFGSALANFGVRLLLEGFAELAPPPAPALDADGRRRDLDAPFSGFVFKVAANMDPRHRDRVAFVRVASGRFRRGMTATHGRTGRPFALRYAHQLFARNRETLDEAVAGDIVGVVGASGLLIGDTLSEDDAVAYPPIPTFAPEHFVTVRNADTSRYKQFRTGLAQLDEEGVVQVLRRPEYGDQEPIFAGVGPLQFDVAAYRIRHEFGAEIRMRPAAYRLAREVPAGQADAVRGQRGTLLTTDRRGRTIVLFASEHALRWAQEDLDGVDFLELGTLGAQRLSKH